jgi:gluconolactonase
MNKPNQTLRHLFAVSRRTFLMATGAGAASLIVPGCGDDGGGGDAPDARPPTQPPDARPAPDAGPDRYAGLDSDAYLGAIEAVATIEGQAFLEGPTMGPDGKIYFTNIPASQILVYDPGAGAVSVFRGDANAANGMLFAPDGRLIVCEGGVLTGTATATGKGRVVAIDVGSGAVEVLADAYMGQDLQPPNDLALDAQGRVYFTARPNATDATDAAQGTVNAVYRIDPDGTVTQLLGWPDVDKPNGIVTAPDDSKLYLLEAHGGAGKKRQLQAYDLDAGGNIANPQVLYDFYPGRSGDGMAIDAQGNLYVAAGLHNLRSTSETLATKPGIHVISPQGQLLAFRETPLDLVTNCRFAGEDLRTLYVTAGNQLLRVPTVNPGKAAYRVTPA